MHRQILLDCLPCLATMLGALAVLLLILRFSRARFDWSRLRSLHSCQDGGVQSLSFVLTLPMFLVVVLFVVQISQLMIGIMVVNYAAFASARAAAVWFPAQIQNGAFLERENVLPEPITPDEWSGNPVTGNSVVLRYDSQFLADDSYKYHQVFAAAALACAPISPSRDLENSSQGNIDRITAAVQASYAAMVPSSQQNTRIPQRLANKLAWSFSQTAVRVQFVDKDTRLGPTYNPRVPVRREYPDGTFEWVRVWNPHEVGWQDPVTTTVTHQFALLPGPGRFLAKYIVRADGQADRTSDRIDRSLAGNESVYTTAITASATMTNEGFKSSVPFTQSRF